MTRRKMRAAFGAGAILTAGALVLTGCGGGSFDDNGGGAAADGELTSSDDPITVLIASSGEAEATAVEDAVAAWSAESGVEASVEIASDLNQQLAQGFAAGSPPDLFYLSPDALAGYADNGSLRAYGDELSNAGDFYAPLVENFTYEDEFYCAPKDFSTLALIINTDLWEAAGLTEDDVPTTWEELATVSQTLTTGGVTGLAFGPEVQRVGAFMAQAGGGLVTDGAATANSPENVEALEYVKANLEGGNFAYATDIGAGWGGEAFGLGSAAMVIEGNWIEGALRNDYPDVNYLVAELPEGPGGPGTLQFTNCWGMAADSPNQQAALELVEYLTASEQQLAFSEAFGIMPSLETTADAWREANPDLAAFINGAEYAQFLPTQADAAAVITDFNAQLESLAESDPTTILDSVQGNLEAVVG